MVLSVLKSLILCLPPHVLNFNEKAGFSHLMHLCGENLPSSLAASQLQGDYASTCNGVVLCQDIFNLPPILVDVGAFYTGTYYRDLLDKEGANGVVGRKYAKPK